MPTEISGSTGVNKIQDNTIVNADINSSAAIAGSKISGGTGKVLQAITAIDTGSWANSSNSFQDTNLSVTITPTSTSNKILIIASVSYSSNLNGSNNGLRLVRGSTDLTGHQIYSLTIDGGGSYQRGVWSWHHLDSPSTTSATTYKVQAGHNTNGNAITLHAANDSITVMEIAG